MKASASMKSCSGSSRLITKSLVGRVLRAPSFIADPPTPDNVDCDLDHWRSVPGLQDLTVLVRRKEAQFHDHVGGTSVQMINPVQHYPDDERSHSATPQQQLKQAAI